MALATRSGAFVLAVAAVVSACGADSPDGVAAPGLDGVPREVTLEAPPLPTTTAVPSAVPDEESVAATTTPPTTAAATEPSATVEAPSPGDSTDSTEASADDAGADAAPAAPTTTVEDPFLRRGDEGPAVVSLQQRLIELEYLAPGGDTGVFDGATADALIDFQAQYGLVVDGIFGPESDRALNAAAASVTDG